MTRKDYQHHIWIYKQRRVKAKKLFKETLDEKYRDIFRRNTLKIRIWNRQIKRLDERKEYMSKILNAVNRYFNVRVGGRNLNKKHKLARGIYYKYCIESKNFRAIWVSKFIGRHGRMAEYGRANFTRSFETKPENREAYYDFKKYYEN